MKEQASEPVEAFKEAFRCWQDLDPFTSTGLVACEDKQPARQEAPITGVSNPKERGQQYQSGTRLAVLRFINSKAKAFILSRDLEGARHYSFTAGRSPKRTNLTEIALRHVFQILSAERRQRWNSDLLRFPSTQAPKALRAPPPMALRAGRLDRAPRRGRRQPL